jgi:hypothetical protein
MLSKFTSDNIEHVTFGTQPSRYFYSNSLGVISGNITILPFSSDRQKKIIINSTGSINVDYDPKFMLNLGKINFLNGNIQSNINRTSRINYNFFLSI